MSQLCTRVHSSHGFGRHVLWQPEEPLWRICLCDIWQTLLFVFRLSDTSFCKFDPTTQIGKGLHLGLALKHDGWLSELSSFCCSGWPPHPGWYHQLVLPCQNEFYLNSENTNIQALNGIRMHALTSKSNEHDCLVRSMAASYFWPSLCFCIAVHLCLFKIVCFFCVKVLDQSVQDIILQNIQYMLYRIDHLELTSKSAVGEADSTPSTLFVCGGVYFLLFSLQKGLWYDLAYWSSLPQSNCLYVAFMDFLAIGNLLQKQQLFKAPAVGMGQ